MGTQSRKRKESIKLTPGKRKQVEQALMLLAEHYGSLLASWSELQREQRDEVLAHSPLLAELTALTAPLRMIEYGY